MKIQIVLEFDGIDPNSEDALLITQDLADSLGTIQTAFDASSCNYKVIKTEEEQTA
jgi:hypothetical protein